MNYNLGDGWFLVSAPMITANWEADSDDCWLVPIGSAGGRALRASTTIYFGPKRPDGASEDNRI